MRTTGSPRDAVAWPFLLPGTTACRAPGGARNQDTIRMLVNARFRTRFGGNVAGVAS
jgi:hypothetical protein